MLTPASSPRVCYGKLDGYQQALASWLGVRQHQSRKQRKTIKQFYVELANQGYTGSDDRVAAYARQWRAKHHQSSASGVFIPLIFAPGEAFQFDWSEEQVVLAGEYIKLQFAHTKLCHSRAFMVQA